MGADPKRLPIFPLAGALLFPRAQLPLHIFEERYKAMVTDAQGAGTGIAMIQPHGSGPNAPLHQVGCIGEIVACEEVEDGRFNILLHGTQRFRLIREASEADTPYRMADVDLAAFDDAEPDPVSATLRAAVEEEARAFADALGFAVDWDGVSRLDDETFINAIAQVAPFDIGSKQALLEEATLRDRAQLIVQLMQFQRLAPGGADADQTLQ